MRVCSEDRLPFAREGNGNATEFGMASEVGNGSGILLLGRDE